MHRAEPEAKEITSQNISYKTAIDRLQRVLDYKKRTEPRDDRQQYFFSLDIAALELAIAHLQQVQRN